MKEGKAWVSKRTIRGGQELDHEFVLLLVQELSDVKVQLFDLLRLTVRGQTVG